MKILLLKPNSVIRKVSPPLGLLYLAGWLRQKKIASYIRIIDARIDGLNKRDIEKILEEHKPDILGISAINIESQTAHAVADISKRINRACKVIIGGAYPTANSNKVLGDKNIDFTVSGEGERALEILIATLTSNHDSTSISGIGLRKDGKILINSPHVFISDLDSIPFPAWDLINVERYFRFCGGGNVEIFKIPRRSIPILTSRGCPLGCLYCLEIFGKTMRYRSIQNIASEIDFLVERYKIEEIDIRDDILNIDQKRMIDICSLIGNRGLKITFSNGLRIDFMNEGIIDKLKQAGAYKVSYVIQPASQRIQRLINRDFDLEKAKEIIDLTIKKGLCVEGFFAIGFPGETKKEIASTIDYAKKTKFHFVNFFLGKSFFSDEKIKNFETRICSNSLIPTAKELKILMLKAYIKFYMNPVRIWNIFKMSNFAWSKLIGNFFAIIRHIFKNNINDREKHKVVRCNSHLKRI